MMYPDIYDEDYSFRVDLYENKNSIIAWIAEDNSSGSEYIISKNNTITDLCDVIRLYLKSNYKAKPTQESKE